MTSSVRQIAVVEKRPIDKLTIKGFKSLQDVDLELGRLNVLIGPNGAGKSNLVSYFRMLIEMLGGRLQLWVAKRGGADRILTFGFKQTPRLSTQILYGDCEYECSLEHTNDDRFVFSKERFSFDTGQISSRGQYHSAHRESSVSFRVTTYYSSGVPVVDHAASLEKIRVYHFHDTSSSAPVKLTSQVHDNRYLRQDAGNLAAYLYMLRQAHEDIYDEIVKTVRLAIPFLDNFVLEREALNTNSIMLKWSHKDFDYEFLPSQLSDGSLRFICLVTALLQPDSPSTIIIDEPELGLHPYAIHLLGALLRSASRRMQVIVATQSPQLLDEFSVDDLIVVELENGVSVFKRLKESQFSYWLEDYSVGELWDKNVLGGGVP
ncbi:MAG: AAA family ATPase [Chloroflexi bacterium]|nr:AAA family ATPase [Chloroflexota bacterium]